MIPFFHKVIVTIQSLTRTLISALPVFCRKDINTLTSGSLFLFAGGTFTHAICLSFDRKELCHPPRASTRFSHPPMRSLSHRHYCQQCSSIRKGDYCPRSSLFSETWFLFALLFLFAIYIEKVKLLCWHVHSWGFPRSSDKTTSLNSWGSKNNFSRKIKPGVWKICEAAIFLGRGKICWFWGRELVPLEAGQRE